MSEEISPAMPAAAPLTLPPKLQKPRLRRWEATEYLSLVHGIQVAPATLAKWATVGGGPAYQKVNRTPVYPKDELDRWACEKLGQPIHSTAEGRAA